VKRVTADSNILISAFLRGGKPLGLLELARAGQIELGVSDATLDETERVPKDKFHVFRIRRPRFTARAPGIREARHPRRSARCRSRDETDNRILECAVAAGSGTDVTGDQHLLSLGHFRGIRIQRVGEFLAGHQTGDEGQNP
jgi:uncharacterized protein